jgi:hypothetical protein
MRDPFGEFRQCHGHTQREQACTIVHSDYDNREGWKSSADEQKIEELQKLTIHRLNVLGLDLR